MTGTVVIIGAGPVGAVAALALAARGVTPRVFESRPRAAGKADGRAIALSWGSRLALERLGIWGRLPRPDPIARVSVSERGAFGSIEFTAADLGTEALGYVVDYGALTAACTDALEARQVPVEYRTAVVRITGAGGAIEHPIVLTLAPDAQIERSLEAGCVVLADGAEGAATEPTLRRQEHAYRQVALVGEVGCAHFMPARAFERFTGAGPLALLPRRDHYACVWVVEPGEARRLLDGGSEALGHALERAAGPAFGAMRWLGVPREVPLALRCTVATGDPRVVAIGNAAQMLHPVAGQGFNLGVRDALALAAAWPAATVMARIAGGAAGDGSAQAQLLLGALARYRQSRRADRGLTVGFTDVLARLTAIDLPLAAAVRGFGLAAIDLLPPLRRRALETLVFGAA